MNVFTTARTPTFPSAILQIPMPLGVQLPIYGDSFTGNDLNPIFILDFVWPEGDFGTAYGLVFWGAICEPGTAYLVGDYDWVSFGYY